MVASFQRSLGTAITLPIKGEFMKLSITMLIFMLGAAVAYAMHLSSDIVNSKTRTYNETSETK